MADYTLAPAPYQTVLDTAGAPVPLACLWTYGAGTTTPIATYSDTLGTVNTNPIRADAAGRWTAYLSAGVAYKFVIEGPATPPAHGALIRTVDNVLGVPAAPPVTTGLWFPSCGGTATYAAREGTYLRVGPLVFARGTLTINVLGTGTADRISGLPFPAFASSPATIGYFAALATPLVWIGANTSAGTDQLGFVGLAAAGSGALGLAGLGNGTALVISVVYTTAAP
jgi:hypothetical protein